MKLYLHSLIPEPERRRVLFSIIGVVSVYGLTIGFIYPLISLKMELRGYTSTWIGVMGTLPFVASIIFSPITPVMMRYVNPTKLVFASIAADISLILLMALFDNIYVWFVCRFLMGIAGTVLFIVSETWINEIAEDRVRGRVLSFYTFTISATLGISPMFIFILGAEGALPFFVAVALMILSLYPLRWTMDSSPDFSGSRVSHVTKFILLAPTAVAASALMAFEEASVLTMLPVYALRNGLTEQHSALFLTVLAFGSMTVQPIIGSLADRFNRYNLLIGSAVLVMLGAISLPLIIQTKISIWIVMFIWGGAISAIYTLALIIIGHRFRGAQLAAGNAAFGLMWGLAGALAPISGGVAMTIWNPNGFVAVLAAATIAFIALAIARRLIERS